jgi:hypothetical protein
MSALNNSALIGASGSTGYQISRSVRLRSSASAYFSRTLTTPSNPKKWTFSAWVKGSFYNGTNYTHLFGTGAGANDTSSNQFIWSGTNSNLAFTLWSINVLITNAVYRDPSAWYHVMLIMDNANATASNRAKIYVNGVEPTYSTDNRASLSTTTNYAINSAILHTIGRWAYNSFAQPEQLDAYITEVNFIDGQALTPLSFGETNAVTGVWQPIKYTGTYGTNGFYLNFSDNSAATAAAIGADYSGNGNNWTPNNISVTAGVTYDSMLDVPTQWADGGNGRGNYCTLNPLVTPALSGGGTLSNGNLRIAGTVSVSNAYARGTMALSGKFYAEFFFDVVNATASIGVDAVTATSGALATSSTSVSYRSGGNKRVLGTESAYGASWVANDIIGVAVDTAANTVEFFKNGVSQGVITSSAFFAQGDCVFAMAKDDIGSPTGFANFGQRPFSYTPPSGFKALNTLNLPTPTIAKGNQYFNANTYSGTVGVAGSVTGVGFQPDFVWVKSRNAATGHVLVDSARGVQNGLFTQSTSAEVTSNEYLLSFNTDGFSYGISNAYSQTSMVSWNWKEGATQGFDIVTYTGNGGTQNISHNLGVAPRMMIVKSRSTAQRWTVFHTSISNAYIYLNETFAADTANAALRFGNNSAVVQPTSSVFTIGNSVDVNQNTTTYVAYLFAAVAGYSAFGTYTGNGSTDGPFVFCGFRPRFILFKKTSATDDWVIYDTARDEYNVASKNLYPNGSFAEDSNTTNRAADILSNGFKLRSSGTFLNGSGATFIYAAFAENPLKFSLAR